MNPSDQEALVAARSIKASRRKWEVRSLSALAVGVAILFIYPLAVFCAILGFFVLCRNHSVECERHEITLRQFAKSRNWYREAQTVLRRVERQKRRVRFYSGASLILTDDITDRILSGDFTARTPPPTGEVPRKPNATSHIALINNVNQVTPPRPTPSYITLPAFHAVLPWPTGDITTEKTPADSNC